MNIKKMQDMVKEILRTKPETRDSFDRGPAKILHTSLRRTVVDITPGAGSAERSWAIPSNRSDGGAARIICHRVAPKAMNDPLIESMMSRLYDSYYKAVDDKWVVIFFAEIRKMLYKIKS